MSKITANDLCPECGSTCYGYFIDNKPTDLLCVCCGYTIYDPPYNYREEVLGCP